MILAAASGCGRLAFDELAPAQMTADASSTDVALAGHDEDGDAIDDALDVCPHIPDPGQQDMDGDRVGDVCDPHPAQPIDWIAFFDPFVSVRSEWTALNGMTVMGDQLVLPVSTNAFRLPIGPGRSHYRIEGRFGAAAGAGAAVQLLHGIDGPGGYYYCELYEFTVATLGLTYTYDGSVFGFVEQVAVPAPISNGPIVLEMTNDPADTRCKSSWGIARDVGGPLPAGLENPTEYEMKIEGVAAVLDYFIDISSDP